MQNNYTKPLKLQYFLNEDMSFSKHVGQELYNFFFVMRGMKKFKL